MKIKIKKGLKQKINIRNKKNYNIFFYKDYYKSKITLIDVTICIVHWLFIVHINILLHKLWIKSNILKSSFAMCKIWCGSHK